jgi:Flp pilus assembly protein TadD
MRFVIGMRSATLVRNELRRLACVVTLGVAVAICTTSTGIAEPFDGDPEAAARDPDYVAGRSAIEKKDWGEAIRRFSAAVLRDERNADLHNYLGYSYRQNRQLDLAFTHYKIALELDPQHRGAHEYIGEAYLLAGEPASAYKHLGALRNICPAACEELSDLDRSIGDYQNARAAPEAPRVARALPAGYREVSRFRSHRGRVSHPGS